MKEYFTITLALAEQALSFIPSDDRDVWVSMAGAIKSEFGEDGFLLWDTWSQSAASYKQSSALSTWRSIRPYGSEKTATIGSLVYLARQCGFEIKPDELSDEEKDKRKAALKEKQQQREREWQAEQKKIKQEQQQAAQLAQKIWLKHLSKRGHSDYLKRKKINPFGVRFVSNAIIIVQHDSGPEIIQGADHVKAFFESYDRENQSIQYFKRGCIVVPIWSAERELVNLQFIRPGGNKTFIKNGRKKGCFHIIKGAPAPSTILECEGYATGATLHQATGLTVVLAFDSGNLPVVADVIKSIFPDCPVAVCGDDDAGNEKNPGRKKALEAARRVNGVAIFPEFSSVGAS